MRRWHSAPMVDRHWDVPTPLGPRIPFVALIQSGPGMVV